MSNNFKLGSKAEQLVFQIFDLTTNRKHYPVKFRMLAQQLQQYALSIQSDVLDSNELRADIPAQRNHRILLYSKIIGNCTKLLSLIKYSTKRQMIGFAASEELTGLLYDIKYITLALRKL